MKNLLLASTSTVHGSGYLGYLFDVLEEHFRNCNTITFIPFARPGGISHEAYTEKTRKAFKQLGKEVVGIHETNNAANTISEAEAIFTGGGNTFVLVNQLYKLSLIGALKEVLTNGTPYLGTSAGTNICGQTIGTTNDMPIVYPPSFEVLKMVPFNINPHYLDPNPDSTHMGETRETRIGEFHQFNELPVIGLREGSYLSVKGDVITLKGLHSARWFEANQTPIEIPSNTIL